LLLRISTERATRTAWATKPQRRRKAGQSGSSNREEEQAQAWSVTTSKRPATLQTAPLACERKATSEVRGQTRGTGPTRRHKRRPTQRKQWRRGSAVTSVSSLGSQAGVRKRQPQRAQRPHSMIQRRKTLDGPAMRPATPLAVENGVGKLAAPRGRA